MALITAPWGVKKGSCLSRPAKGIIVKLVQNDSIIVMDYKKKNLLLMAKAGLNSSESACRLLSHLNIIHKVFL